MEVGAASLLRLGGGPCLQGYTPPAPQWPPPPPSPWEGLSSLRAPEQERQAQLPCRRRRLQGGLPAPAPLCSRRTCEGHRWGGPGRKKAALPEESVCSFEYLGLTVALSLVAA